MEEEIGVGRLNLRIGWRPVNTHAAAKVLFDDLKQRFRRRGKSKALSTASDVLRIGAAHEIVPQVLDYRQRMKLKSTYVDALPALVNPKTGRLHTTFNQCGAATGRLSSSNPNLQNIPIRTGLGREIRAHSWRAQAGSCLPRLPAD
jgi:DNA polymerase-1